MSNKITDHQVAADVFAFTGTDVNWVIIRDGSDLTLVDGGWHGDVASVERSIRSLGRRPEDVRAILLTHAHADHTGALNHFHDRYGVPLYMDVAELPNARGEVSETGGPADVAKRLYRPQVLCWACRMILAGGLRHVTVPDARAFPHDGELDLPGRPVPIATHGHTSGHTSYLLPNTGLLISGDALVTAHPTFNGVGPRLLPSYFTHDQDCAVSSLSVLADVSADTFVPGHGPVWHGSMTDAVDQALEHAGASGGPGRRRAEDRSA